MHPARHDLDHFDSASVEPAIRERVKVRSKVTLRFGPARLDVVSARQELVLPPTTTFDEAHKFGMFMIKAVLDGRVRLLIDPADVNLRR